MFLPLSRPLFRPMFLRATCAAGLALLGCCVHAPASAAQTLRLDANAPKASPEQGYFHMGAARSPSGHGIGINNLSLTYDAKPWLPVMGEFHYSRMAPEFWDEQLAKIKSSGVDIVATYVIWNHHEETAGYFNFSGDRDLRRFVDLCHKHGLYVVLRLGPWAHGEVRYGGTPDWLVNAMPVRRSDPQYLRYVERYWGQLAQQVKGMMWKDGGPVIAVQLENEYNQTGPQRGAEHISDLKQLALKLGFDVPLYTVTGWDNTRYPKGEVAPVFGGYPEEPWLGHTRKMPPSEPYAFRFGSRTGGGDLGSQTKSNTGRGDADTEYEHTPFLGAEFAGGSPSMYRRRGVMAADDIAAMLTVQLGSGVSLFGYYMYQGGRNPKGNTTLEENSLLGAPNDLPLITYDFQAPLGQYGDQRPVLGKVRRVHTFVKTFGPDLATMPLRKPDVIPGGRDDLKTARWAVRSNDDAGYLFFSNYVRQYAMAEQREVNFSVKLPGETLSFPRTPLNIPSGAYFIWPFNLKLDGALLKYATAQPLTQFKNGDDTWVVLFAAGGLPVELAFDTSTATVLRSSGRSSRKEGVVVVDRIRPGLGEALSVKTQSGQQLHFIVLSDEQASSTLVADFQGARRLFVSEADLYADGQDIVLNTLAGKATVSVFPALTSKAATQAGFKPVPRDGVFERFEIAFPTRKLQASFKKIRDSADMPAPKGSQQPMPQMYGRSGAWEITLPADALKGVKDAWLNIRYRGDVARLFSEVELLDDNFFDGRTWRIGLRRYAQNLAQPLTLTVLPLRADSPVYIQDELRPQMAAGSQVAELDKVELQAEYEARLLGQVAH